MNEEQLALVKYRLKEAEDSGICQWKLDTLLNNLDSKCRVDICFG